MQRAFLLLMPAIGGAFYIICCRLKQFMFYYSRCMHPFVVGPELDEGSNHERLAGLVRIRSTLRGFQREWIQGQLRDVYAGYIVLLHALYKPAMRC
jgi:hypothetical protein